MVYYKQLKPVRIECTESVVVNNIIIIYKAAANHKKIGCTCCRELYTVTLSLAVYLHDSTKGDGLQKGGGSRTPLAPPYSTLVISIMGVLRAKMCMAKIRVWATKL